MPAPDPDTRAHLEWLGFIQPNGLVVSAPALVKAGAVLNRQDAEGQNRLAACLRERELDPVRGPEPCLPDFREFAAAVLGWGFSPRGYAGTEEAPIPSELAVSLPDYGETLRPRFAVRERDPGDGQPPWQLLVQVLGPGQDFDAPAATASGDGGAGGSPGSGSGGGLRRLEASPHGRIERLLRGAGVSAGLLFNGVALRLVSAPRGESSGWMDFRVADMIRPAGRPLCSALRLLLSEQRLFALPRGQRLAALLEDSRKYQNEVSERLSEQVMHALYELLRGLQAAHDASRGELLREPLSPGGDRDDVYRALLSVILRLVFLLYAEERGVLPEDETFARHYSLAGLYRRLREDAALHPDTMDQRFGAWAQLLVLFRLIHDGAPAWRTGGALDLPERLGALFNPDRFPFLEGRHAAAGARQTIERVRPPLVSDGAVHRVLEKLFVLDGERISYRTLDVEQIGSVYETIMGFRMEVATGPSVAVKPAKKLGAPSTVDLEALLAEPAGRRARWLQARTDRNVTDAVAKGLRAARTVDDLHAALDRVLDKDAAPDLVPPGALVLQPNEERRRSGSHYTPRALTEPVVRHALAPVLERLRGDGHNRAPPTPAQILDLKVCDPAMGSGAFLVEACRQLADALIEAWGAHGEMPAIPPDEDEVIHARRLVAQRCLYGIDRNPTAVDLAKVSLWLSTLARDHPLTFVDHAFRHGDSLVGLTRRQIESLDWAADARSPQRDFKIMRVRERMAEVAELRRRIREAGEEVSDRERHDLWHDAHDELDPVRLSGDLVLAAFFAGSKPKQREERRREFAKAVLDGEAIRYLSWIEEQRHANLPLAPFHWEIEFPEVFDRENPGFDAIVGNPPFQGGRIISATQGSVYSNWLLCLHERSNGGADLVAHFFRRAFDLVRRNGAFGLIATNTIAQGDTRSTGLRWICEHGGEIYRVRRRVKWPGLAAVVVSVLHVAKGRFPGAKCQDGEATPDRRAETSSAGSFPGAKRLDGEAVETITAFLFHRGGHRDPARLAANAGKSFQGSIILGMGFTFDDTDKKGVASPLAEMWRLIEDNPRNRQAIFPYIGGEEVNTSPTHAHHRYVINFRDWPLLREEKAWELREGVGEVREDARESWAPGKSEDVGASWADADEARRRELRRQPIVPFDYPEPVAADWPNLLAIVEDKVKPERNKKDGSKYPKMVHEWWKYWNARSELHAAIARLEWVLAISRIGQHAALTFLPADMVYADSVIVFPFDTHAAFCALQSRPHEVWARFFGSSMKDDLRYTPSDCFETFPFPENWDTHSALEAAGKAYYDFRAALMVRNGEGLTRTYNRFHDPDKTDSDITELRRLHTAMDHTVLTAYGWCDLATKLTATGCDFLPDYAIDEEEWAGKKKPYRYRWPNAIRDEVLTRLLELNADRAAEEARTGTANRAKLVPGGSGPRPQRRHAARNRSRPVAEPRGLWENNPPNDPDPGANAGGQEGDEPDLGASVDGQGNADGQED